jgi:transposase
MMTNLPNSPFLLITFRHPHNFTGHLCNENKKPSYREVARKVKCSHSTVCKVLGRAKQGEYQPRRQIGHRFSSFQGEHQKLIQEFVLEGKWYTSPCDLYGAFLEGIEEKKLPL